MSNKQDKLWTDALRRAIHRESKGKGSPKWLDVIADRVVREAATGEGPGQMSAAKEIGDRLDGKPVAPKEHSGPNGGDIPMSVRVRWK